MVLGVCQLSVGCTCTQNRSCSECLEVGSVALAHGVASLSACGMNVHHRCQTKVANLCGINQKLMAEALAMIESTQQVGLAFRGQVPAVSTQQGLFQSLHSWTCSNCMGQPGICFQALSLTLAFICMSISPLWDVYLMYFPGVDLCKSLILHGMSRGTHKYIH